MTWIMTIFRLQFLGIVKYPLEKNSMRIINSCLIVIMIFSIFGCDTETKETLSPYVVEGNYIVFENPYARGTVDVMASGEKVKISATTVSATTSGICEWEDELVFGKQAKVPLEDSEGYVKVSFDTDFLTLESENYPCGLNTYLDGTFIKVGSPTYNKFIAESTPLPDFEEAVFGRIQSYIREGDNYELIIKTAANEHVFKGKTQDPAFTPIEQEMRWAKLDGPVALFQVGKSINGFASIEERDLRLKNYTPRPDKIILEACYEMLEEKGNECLTLRISESNPVFYVAEQYLSGNVGKLLHIASTTGGEVLAMNEIQAAQNQEVVEIFRCHPRMSISAAKDLEKNVG